jgi:hypothetical protein
VHSVEHLVGLPGPRVAFERRAARDQVRLDVVTARVPARDQLVGPAVEQKRGSGLLAHVCVGAGIRWELGDRERREVVIGAGRRTALVVADDPVVVGRPRFQAGDFDRLALGRGAERDFFGRQRGAAVGVAARLPVLEVEVGRRPFGIHRAAKHDAVGVHVRHVLVGVAGDGGGREGVIEPGDGSVGVYDPEPVVIGGAFHEAGELRRDGVVGGVREDGALRAAGFVPVGDASAPFEVAVRGRFAIGVGDAVDGDARGLEVGRASGGRIGEDDGRPGVEDLDVGALESVDAPGGPVHRDRRGSVSLIRGRRREFEQEAAADRELGHDRVAEDIQVTGLGIGGDVDTESDRFEFSGREVEPVDAAVVFVGQVQVPGRVHRHAGPASGDFVLPPGLFAFGRILREDVSFVVAGPDVSGSRFDRDVPGPDRDREVATDSFPTGFEGFDPTRVAGDVDSSRRRRISRVVDLDRGGAVEAHLGENRGRRVGFRIGEGNRGPVGRHFFQRQAHRPTDRVEIAGGFVDRDRRSSAFAAGRPVRKGEGGFEDVLGRVPGRRRGDGDAQECYRRAGQRYRDGEAAASRPAAGTRPAYTDPVGLPQHRSARLSWM